jgi:hypothetical protein
VGVAQTTAEKSTSMKLRQSGLTPATAASSSASTAASPSGTSSSAEGRRSRKSRVKRPESADATLAARRRRGREARDATSSSSSDMFRKVRAARAERGGPMAPRPSRWASAAARLTKRRRGDATDDGATDGRRSSEAGRAGSAWDDLRAGRVACAGGGVTGSGVDTGELGEWDRPGVSGSVRPVGAGLGDGMARRDVRERQR